MSKKILKRSLALGALMAFVITGSALAAVQGQSLNLTKNDTISGSAFIKTDGRINSIAGNNFDLTVDGGTGTSMAFRAYEGSITVNNVNNLVFDGNYTNSGVYASYGGKPFGTPNEGVVTMTGIGSITQTEDSYIMIGFNNYGGTIDVSCNDVKLHNVDNAVFTQAGGTITINAVNNIELKNEGNYTLVGAYNFKENSPSTNSQVNLVAGGNIVLKSTEGTALNANSATYPNYGDNVGTNSIILNATGDVSIEAKVAVRAKKGATEDAATVDIQAKNITIEATEYAVDAKENGKVEIGKNASFESADITGNISSATNANVDLNLGNNGSLTGIVSTDTTSTTSLDMGTDSVWNVKGKSSLTTLTGNSGTLVVNDVTENLVTVGTDSIDALTVATITEDGNTNETLAKLSAVVQTKAGDAVANQVQLKNAIYDNVTATVNGLGDVAVDEGSKEVAAANVSVNDMAAIGLMSWRAEMNDMNKRMGELRNANGEHGVWVRMVRGESEYNSVKNQYNQYQLGYDEKLSVDKRWTVGVALSYTDAENNFAQGNGESTNKALSIYGSKLNEDGTFIDLIAKYARLENDFETFSGMGAADYDANGYSFSAEFGKRIQQGKGLWIEPQVELTYGKVGSVDYVTENKVNVAQDSMESLVGRIGFSLGKNIKDGNVYARASYLYDFDGETKAVLDGDAVLENDLGGGWWEVGVGANINLSKATYIYADIEKTFGGEVDTNWQWNLGVRYSF